MRSDPMFRALRFFGLGVRPVIASVLLGAAGALSALGLAALSAWLITRAWQMPPVLYLSVAVTAVRALGISRALFRYLERLATHNAALDAMSKARTRIYRVLAGGSPAYSVGLRQSQLLARTADDVDDIGNAMIRGLVPMAVGAVTALAAVIIMATVSPLAAVILAVALLVSGVIAPWLAARGAARAIAGSARAREDVADETSVLLWHGPELVVAPIAREYGVDYLLATVILAGVFQLVLGALGVGRLMRFIPRSVMVGFVNALAILIFTAQLPHLIDVPWPVYPMVAVGLAIMVGLPRLTRAVPAPLVAIVVLTAATVGFTLAVPNVGDEGELPDTLPHWLIPDVPLNLETLRIIAPVAAAMAVVGLLESLMTAKLVDDITDTHSNKTREACGQGIANVVTGFFGGMGGCAMIGQTMINVKESAARTRISTFLAGVFLLILVVGFGGLVAQIPMAALVAVMVMVAAGTFDWHSIAPATLRRMPRSETAVMVMTVAITVATSNLAFGVGAGVITAALLFVRRVAHFTGVDVVDSDASVRTYRVSGELFFASSNDLVYQFDYADDPPTVIVDLTDAHVWDASTVASLDAIETRYRAKGKTVEFIGLNPDSAQRHDRLRGTLG